MAYDIFIAAGQSNMMYEYSYDPGATAPGPNLFQYKQDGTIAPATQSMDFASLAGHRLNSYAVNFCRDYYIPNALQAGRDVLIIPVAVGGAGFYNNWAVGSAIYETMVAQINGALAHDAGNALKGIFWQHGEQDVGDFAVAAGKYATMSMSDGYNAYMTEMIADLSSRISGGFDIPLLVGGMPPDLSAAGLSADGIDHHNSNMATMVAIQQNLPNILSKCAYVDPLSPHKLVTEAETNQYVIQYWLHFSQISGRHMAHRAWKAYHKLAYGREILTTSVPRLVCTPTYAASPTTQGAHIGDLAVSGGSGTYAYALISSAGGRIQLNGSDSSIVEVGATASAAPTPPAVDPFEIIIRADNGSSAFDHRLLVHYAALTTSPYSVGSPGPARFCIVSGQ